MPARTDIAAGNPIEKSQSSLGLIRSLGLDNVPRTRPMYRGLIALLERTISRGEMPPGTRLPAERDLAKTLRMSRTTVVRAYRELEARGLVRGYVGRGTFVAAKPEMEKSWFVAGRTGAANELRITSSDAVVPARAHPGGDPRELALKLTSITWQPASQ